MGAPAKNSDLHGNAPDEASAALILIDMINDFEFEGAQKIFDSAFAVAKNIAELKKRARRASIPVIYVNDNFGRWRSDLSKLVEHCLTENVRGKPVVEMLAPDADDYFVLKPKHSAFFSTTLDTLLDYLKVKSLILTGIAGNVCVLFTANDAYMRDYNLFIPEDCIASNSEEENRYALDHMKRVLEADTRLSVELDLERINSKTPAGLSASS